MHKTVFRDFVLLMVLGFVAMVVWMLPFLNPKSEKAETEPPGNLIVAITWPPGDTDVDLWMMGPQEVRPVGYSNKGGILINLLRDDLGTQPDATPFNYENAYTRGITPGEYVVNVHCYRCPVVPVPVNAEITVNTGEPGKSSLHAIATASSVLTANGQEKTILRFKLTKEGELVPGSMNSVFRPLRDLNGKPGDN